MFRLHSLWLLRAGGGSYPYARFNPQKVEADGTDGHRRLRSSETLRTVERRLPGPWKPPAGTAYPR